MLSVLIALYGLWLLAIVLRQASPAARRLIAAVDLFQIVPDFRLFAGVPPFDYQIMIRAVHADGRNGEWTELVIGRRPAHAAIWHPQLLERTIAARVARRARQSAGPSAASAMQQFPPYASFIRFLLIRVIPDDALGVKLRVISAIPGRPATARVVFESDVIRRNVLDA